MRRSPRRRPRIIPYPIYTLEDSERFTGLDLPTLTASELWAEQVIVTQALAERLRQRRRDRLMVVGLDVMSQSEWLRSRLHAVVQEARRRRTEASHAR